MRRIAGGVFGFATEGKIISAADERRSIDRFFSGCGVYRRLSAAKKTFALDHRPRMKSLSNSAIVI
jgi:hypothetical protein